MTESGLRRETKLTFLETNKADFGETPQVSMRYEIVKEFLSEEVEMDRRENSKRLGESASHGEEKSW